MKMLLFLDIKWPEESRREGLRAKEMRIMVELIRMFCTRITGQKKLARS